MEYGSWQLTQRHLWCFHFFCNTSATCSTDLLNSVADSNVQIRIESDFSAVCELMCGYYNTKTNEDDNITTINLYEASFVNDNKYNNKCAWFDKFCESLRTH